MEEKKDIYILAIESSCDETAAAVVKNGREVLSNVISSQIDLHTLYGGVVPEIASRKHVENIDGVIKKALADADMTLEEMDAPVTEFDDQLWISMVDHVVVHSKDDIRVVYRDGIEK